MIWHSFLEYQTKYCIEHPAGSAATTVIFGFIAGMQCSQLFHRDVVFFDDYAFLLVFLILAGEQAYFLARAFRLLRANEGQLVVQHDT